MSRGKIIAGLVALVVVGGVIAGVVTSAQNAVPLVTTAKVTKETLGVIVTASGKVEAAEKADVFPATAGTLESVDVKDGQKVKDGDVVAVMDRAPLRLQVAQARAALQGARAQLDGVNRGVPAAIDRAAASAGITAARTGYNAAKDAYDMIKAVYDASPEPVQHSMEATLTAARIAKQQAYAGLQNARAGLNKLTVMGRVAVARSAANSAVDQANESLAVARDMVSDAEMTAPMDGIVIFNALGVPGLDGSLPKAAHGAAVGPQAAPFTIVQLGALNFNAQVDEADIDRAKKGMSGAVRLDAFPSDTIKGKVVTIRAAAIQTTTGGIAFPVLLRLDAPGKHLLLGMSGSVDIEVSAVPDAITVPIEALFDENGKKYVFQVQDGKVAKREVTTGAMTDTRAQSISGVSVGAEIAVSNLSTLKDGTAVRTK